MRYIWIDEYLLSKAGVTGENTVSNVQDGFGYVSVASEIW